MHPLKALFDADKTIPVFPGWGKPEVETGYSWFNVALDIQGVTEHGLFLFGGCYLDYPDQHVTFELHIARTDGRRRTPLGRLDWKSLNGGHSNQRRRGHPLSGLRVSDTHLHDFGDNWRETDGQMIGANLPMARETEALPAFETARDFAGKSFKISNIGIVSRPDWQYSLFGSRP